MMKEYVMNGYKVIVETWDGDVEWNSLDEEYDEEEWYEFDKVDEENKIAYFSFESIYFDE